MTNPSHEPRRSRGDAGYIYEIPMLAIAVAIGGLILLKVYPRPWFAMAVASGAGLGLGAFLCYNFLAPGWLPGGFGQAVSISVTVLGLVLVLLTPALIKVHETTGKVFALGSLGVFGLLLAFRIVLMVIRRLRRPPPPPPAPDV